MLIEYEFLQILVSAAYWIARRDYIDIENVNIGGAIYLPIEVARPLICKLADAKC